MEVIKILGMVFLLVVTGFLAVASSLMAYLTWHDFKGTDRNKRA